MTYFKTTQNTWVLALPKQFASWTEGFLQEKLRDKVDSSYQILYVVSVTFPALTK